MLLLHALSANITVITAITSNATRGAFLETAEGNLTFCGGRCTPPHVHRRRGRCRYIMRRWLWRGIDSSMVMMKTLFAKQLFTQGRQAEALTVLASLMVVVVVVVGAVVGADTVGVVNNRTFNRVLCDDTVDAVQPSFGGRQSL